MTRPTARSSEVLLDRSSGAGSVEQDVEQGVQNRSVALLEARSTERGSGSGRAEVQQTTLDSVLVRMRSDYAIISCITLLFIVMFIVIVN